jgi:hypothetical protein
VEVRVEVLMGFLGAGTGVPDGFDSGKPFGRVEPWLFGTNCIPNESRMLRQSHVWVTHPYFRCPKYLTTASVRVWTWNFS